MKFLNFFLVTPFFLLTSLSSSHFDFYGDIGGARAEFQDISFYGGLGSAAPAFLHDPTLWGTRVGGGISYTTDDSVSFLARNHFFWGSKRGNKTTSFVVIVPSLDGIQSPKILPDDKTQSFKSTYQENQFDLLSLYDFRLCDGFTITPGMGYSLIHQKRRLRSQIGSITTDERLTTFYHGGKFEVSFRQRCRGPLSFGITPIFGVYKANTHFIGVQESEITLSKDAICFQGALEIAGQYLFEDKSIEVFGFIDYLSYVPSVLNPKKGGEVVQLVYSNSFRYGAGAAIQFTTSF